MKYLLLVGILALAACDSTSVVRSSRTVVVQPDESMYVCPIVTTFPDTHTLTDIQVARLLVELYQNNITCKNSINAIKSFLESARSASTPN